MRTTGWVLLVIGIIALLGASYKGHHVMGPAFFIALGLWLISKKKKQ